MKIVKWLVFSSKPHSRWVPGQRLLNQISCIATELEYPYLNILKNRDTFHQNSLLAVLSHTNDESHVWIENSVFNMASSRFLTNIYSYSLFSWERKACNVWGINTKRFLAVRSMCTYSKPHQVTLCSGLSMNLRQFAGQHLGINYSRLLEVHNPALYEGFSHTKQIRVYSISRKKYEFPELKPEDLEEMFVRGSGPGGQKVNKTANCVVLKHKPSGIVVKCQETRSLEQNRKLARLKMEEKLDQLLNGESSFISLQKAAAREEKSELKRRAKDRLELKKTFKDRENLD